MFKVLKNLFVGLIAVLCITTFVGCNDDKNQSNNQNQENFLTTTQQFYKILDKTNDVIDNNIEKINKADTFSAEQNNENIATMLSKLLNKCYFISDLEDCFEGKNIELLQVYGYDGNYFYISSDDLKNGLEFFVILSDNDNFAYYYFDIVHNNFNIQNIVFKYLETCDVSSSRSILIGQLDFDIKNNKFSAFSGKPISFEDSYNFLTTMMNDDHFRQVSWGYSWSVMFDFNNSNEKIDFEIDRTEVVPGFKNNILNFNFDLVYANEAVCTANFESQNISFNELIFTKFNKIYVNFDNSLCKIIILEVNNV